MSVLSCLAMLVQVLRQIQPKRQALGLVPPLQQALQQEAFLGVSLLHLPQLGIRINLAPARALQNVDDTIF